MVTGRALVARARPFPFPADGQTEVALRTELPEQFHRQRLFHSVATTLQHFRRSQASNIVLGGRMEWWSCDLL